MAVTMTPEEFAAELETMAGRCEDFSVPLTDIATGIEGEIRNHLMNEETPSGKMKRLSEPYRTWKSRHFPGKTILRATDAMLSSISSESGPLFAEAGPADEKAAYHASYEPRSVIPLRDFVHVRAESYDAVDKMLADFVMGNS